MLRICPKCGKVAGYNSWFKAFYCRNCGELFNGGADNDWCKNKTIVKTQSS